MEELLELMRFNDKGLIPAIIQEAKTGRVLMLAYMNKASLLKTLSTKVTWFYSRSRKGLWNKGATSGNIQVVKEVLYDCDKDALLVMVEQKGVACHEGCFSCFRNNLTESIELSAEMPVTDKEAWQTKEKTITELYEIIINRKQNPQKGSYTSYLLEVGKDKILKKVVEEAAETIIASKNDNHQEILNEMADLWYHCVVLLAYHELLPEELFSILEKRRTITNCEPKNRHVIAEK